MDIPLKYNLFPSKMAYVVICCRFTVLSSFPLEYNLFPSKMGDVVIFRGVFFYIKSF